MSLGRRQRGSQHENPEEEEEDEEEEKCVAVVLHAEHMSMRNIYILCSFGCILEIGRAHV